MTTPKVVLTSLLTFVLVVLSVFTGLASYESRIEQVEQLSYAEKDRLRSVDNYYEDFLVEGLSIFRKPSPLLIFVSGVEGDAASRGSVSLLTGSSLDVSVLNQSPILAVFGFLDISFVVTVLLSLFAVLYGYDAISGEHAAGTLKHMLANGVKRSTIVLAKIAANTILILLPFIFYILVSVLWINLFNGVEFSMLQWIQIALILLLFCIYLTLFVALSVCISSLTSRPNVSFLVLLIIWVVLIAIVPRSSVLIAQSMAPAEDIADAHRSFGEQIGPLRKGMSDRISEAYAGYWPQYFERLPQEPDTKDAALMREYEESMVLFRKWQDEQFERINARVMEAYISFQSKVGSVSSAIYSEYQRQLDRQTNLALVIKRFASPAGALRIGTSRIAQTGLDAADKEYRDYVYRFVNSLDEYHREMVRKDSNLMNFNYNYEEPNDLSEAHPGEPYFAASSFAGDVGSALQDFALLFLSSLVFLSGAVLAFSRYDVR